MVREIDIQNAIRLALQPYAYTFRANVGLFFTKDGRPVQTGLPPGFSDLFGFRKSDGRMFFIEVKKPGGRRSEKQKQFIAAMKRAGALAGFALSAEEALAILEIQEEEQEALKIALSALVEEEGKNDESGR
ncbi:MAG: VRR-NUC domain-containing protein [Peptostreptococcaceae bacterium]|nr:VRR-NUC domain-containing protein [Peptostreptococcaceae bacterium]